MSLFDAYSAQKPNTSPQQPQQKITPMQQLRQNPAATLKQAGFQVPEGMNNPYQIVQHLLQSGQVSNPRLMQMQQLMSRIVRR